MLQIFEKRASHIPALQRIFLESRQKTFHWLDTSDYNLTDYDNQTEGEFVLVAVLNNEAVGFISLWMPNNFIHHLYIDEKYQHQKIGSKLLEEAIQLMDSPITLKCLANNTKAIDFYTRKGFIQTETGKSAQGEYILFSFHK